MQAGKPGPDAKEQMEKKRDVKGVEAVERALLILNALADGKSNLSLADLARKTGLYKSTILRLAVSLERFHYVVRHGDGRFGLGSAIGSLSATYHQMTNLADLIRPELQRLSEATAETASLFVMEGDQRLCLYRHEPERAIRHALQEGMTMSLAYGASSKILKAWSEPEEKAWSAIRAQGYATSRGERDPEVAAIALPILALDGVLIGALTLSGPLSRFTPERERQWLQALRDSDRMITRRLG